MGLCLLPLLFVDVQARLGLLTILLLMHTLAAATQDVVIDAACAVGGVGGVVTRDFCAFVS